MLDRAQPLRELPDERRPSRSRSDPGDVTLLHLYLLQQVGQLVSVETLARRLTATQLREVGHLGSGDDFLYAPHFLCRLIVKRWIVSNWTAVTAISMFRSGVMIKQPRPSAQRCSNDTDMRRKFIPVVQSDSFESRGL